MYLSTEISQKLISQKKETELACVGAELGPTHENTWTRSERRHDAAPMLRLVVYTGQTGCRRAGRRRDQRTSPGKDPSGQAHAGLF